MKAGEAADRLLSRTPASCHTPQVLRNFQALLQAYRSDSEIRAAAALYERCHGLFTRFREVLRLSAEQMDQLRQQTADRNDSDGPLAQIALKHLDRYWGHLVPEH